MYVNKQTKKQVSLQQIMQETGASFSDDPSAETLNDFGYAPAAHADYPEFDPETHAATKDDLATEISGEWVFGWTVSALSADESLRRKAESAQQYLTETDWYATRLAETGEAIPEDVKAKRAECREVISQWRENGHA